MDSKALLDLLAGGAIQASVLAVVVWWIVRVFARDRPHLAHALWALVLLKCVTPPLWSSPSSPFSWLNRSELSSSMSSSSGPPSGLPGHDDHSPSKPHPFGTVVVHIDHQGSAELLIDSSGEDAAPSQAGLGQGVGVGAAWRLAPVVIAMWLIGAGLCLLTMAARLFLFLHRVRRHTLPANESIEQTVASLAARLGIRRKVQVRVVTSAIGPAVVGFWRPTILLPAAIVDGKIGDELEPLLAHELIHIRRGDLYWATLQTFATSLGFFNPLVWMASGMLTREAERSCDEETISSLGYQGATYARSLLDVLERKHQLHVAPALPGVRPVDITANRLERIMRLGQGCHRRGPRWVAPVLLIGMAVVLPGAALVDAKEGSKNQPTGAAVPASFVSANSEFPASAGSPAEAKVDGRVSPSDPQLAHSYSVGVYDVSDVLQGIVKEEKISLQAAKSTLVPWLSIPGTPMWRYHTEKPPQGLSIEFPIAGHGLGKLGGDQPMYKVVAETLYFFGTQKQREGLRDSIAHYRKYGFGQVTVQVEFASIPAKMMETLDVEWTICNPDPMLESSPSQAFGTLPAEAPSTTSPQGPTIMSVLDADRANEIRRQLQADTRTNVLMAPKVTLFSGQDGSISEQVLRPFVVSLKPTRNEDGSSTGDFEPVIQTIPCGVTVQLKTVIADDGDSVNLECELRTTKILDVETFTFKRPGGPSEKGDTLTVQMPSCATRVLNAHTKLANGSTLILSGAKPAAGDEGTVTVALIQCQTVRSLIAESTPASSNELLNLPSPSKAEPSASFSNKQPQPNQYSSPDYTITSANRAKSANHAPLINALKQFDLDVAVDGDVKYEINNDQIVIRGEALTIDGGPEGDVVLTCMRGEVKIDRKQNTASYHFTGKVKLSLGDSSATADEVYIDGDTITFRGNVKISIDGMSIQGDGVRRSGEGGTIQIDGNAMISRPSIDGPPLVLKADHLHWNPTTNEIQAPSRKKGSGLFYE